MSDEQQPIPGTEGAGRRVRPRVDDTAEQVKGLRATVTVLGRDILDLRAVAEQAAATSATAATAAGHVRGDVAKLADALTGHLDGYATWRDQVNEAIEALTDDDEKKPKGQPSWLTLDGDEDKQVDQAVKLLADLAAWVGQVWTRYPDTTLPHCWAYHPWAVSELLGVWQAWKHAYTGKSADPTRVEEWLDRWRPNAAGRLSKGLAGCSLADHGASGPQAYLPPRVPGGDDHLEGVAMWWSTTHGQGRAPAPTAGAVQAERAEQT